MTGVQTCALPILVYEVAVAPQPTEEEKIFNEIRLLKSQLTATDYKALKFSDGALTEEEYAPIRAQRQVWRDQINALEARLGITPINYMEGHENFNTKTQ